jgi:hypothetical protein
VVPARQTSILSSDGLDSESCGCRLVESKLHLDFVFAAVIGVTVLSKLEVTVAMSGGSSLRWAGHIVCRKTPDPGSSPHSTAEAGLVSPLPGSMGNVAGANRAKHEWKTGGHR